MCLAIEAACAVDEVKDIRDKAVAIQMYAKQAKNLDAERHAAEIRVRAERKCGELLADTPKAKGSTLAGKDSIGSPIVLPPNGVQTLSDLGISKRQSSEWQKLAAVPDAQFEQAIAEQEVPSASGVLNHRAQGTGQNEWYTPLEYIEAVRDVLGTIDLDPASSSIANAQVKADRYFTAEDDALSKEWTATTLFLNPPYAQPLIAQFIEKLVAEVGWPGVDAILLTHNYTDTAWFHMAEDSCNAICFTRGRIGFLSPTGEKASPTQGQAFFYFGRDVKRFAERFQSIGFVVVPYAF
jgi:ParB family chromosome partitioning protein